MRFSINGQKFEANSVLLIRFEGDPVFGKIRRIFCKRNVQSPLLSDITLDVILFETVRRNEHLQAYEIRETELIESIIFDRAIYNEWLAISACLGERYIVHY